MTETTVKISGMMCGMCEAHICDVIRARFAVRKVTASHSKGQAVILSENGLDEAALRQALLGALGSFVDIRMIHEQLMGTQVLFLIPVFSYQAEALCEIAKELPKFSSGAVIAAEELPAHEEGQVLCEGKLGIQSVLEMAGFAGAALATGIGQMVPLIFYLIVYFVSPIPVRLRSGCLKPDAKMALQLYSIGVPAILNLALPSVLITFLNSLLAVYSQSYVVVLGIYYKLQTFLYLPANGIVQGLRPIIGYNYGAGEYDRVKKLYRTSMGMCAAIMAAGTVLCLALSGQLIGLFSSNAETIAIGCT